jgi:beta-glucosidase
MVGRRLFVLIIILGISLTFFTVVDSISNVYPAIQSRTWDQAVAMAKAFVTQLTFDEKCKMTAGVGGPCAGNVLPIPRLNFSGLCFLDSPNGVGYITLHSTAYPGAINIAATWDRNLFYQRAATMGTEFRGKGINFALGPMMNIDRNARGGRNWEGYGSDPYLAGENAFAFVQGLQDQGVVATAKHYICNEQETNRMYGTSGSISKGYSANLDDKTMHEIYLWPFASSVAAGVGSVMCSYNQINGTPACQNDKTQNGLLKGELGYLGNIMSDWGATKTGVESALGGLDMDMPGGDGLMGSALAPAVKNGTLPQTRIDDMITRIMAPYYLLAQDQGYPSVDTDRNVVQDNDKINHLLSRAGMILLKNTNNVLPVNITSDTCLYVYGEAAGPSSAGDRPGGYSQQGGAIYQGGGSGFVIPPYALDPLSALMIKGRDAHVQIRYVTNQNDYNAINESLHGGGCANPKCLVFISAYSSEGFDRGDLHALDNGDKLIQTVATNCLNTVVIINSASQLNLEAWIDHPNAKGVLWSGMPGAEYGSALVDVLFGDYNPGGKLVFTLAKNDTDYGTDISPTYDSNYTEGVFLDYRHFDQQKITPRYYFGYGLSYTNFTFAQLHISKASSDRQRRMRSYENFGRSGLYDPVYEIKFTVTNIGKVNGSEVPQLYLGFPTEAQQPPKVLRGFERVYLAAGESKQVTLALKQKDISYWNVVNQKWTVASGDYTVWISTSANNTDVKLQSSFHI